MSLGQTETAFLSKAHNSGAIKQNTVRLDLITIKISYKTNDPINKAKRTSNRLRFEEEERK